ncbi:MAG: sugar ABC transporter ATP-binding protein [Parvibaculaceae bacterium]
MSAPLLRVASVSKRFGEVTALSDVSLTVESGAIHALVGENGAGKSTLIGILAGVLQPDGGGIEISGRSAALKNPRAAQEFGIATVFQELSLAPSVSVGENIFAGRLPRIAGLVDWKSLHRMTADLMAKLGATVDPHARLSDYPIGTRQLVEIAKALSLEARILLLDEPTSALDQADKARLFDVLRGLAARGWGIVYISHHLNEVVALCDRVTVLRDGRVSGRFAAGRMKADAIVRAMVGRPAATDVDWPPCRPGEVVLTARRLSSPPVLREASLELRAGEIVGLAGLMGSGRSELACALCGLIAPQEGALELGGKPVKLTGLRAAMARGVAYVPSERKTDGLFLDRSVTDNIVAARFTELARFGVADRAAGLSLARRFIDRLGIRLRDPGDPAGRLSGGNQQKVLLAKWLALAPRVLIVEEPTRGVDVVAKFEIHRVLRELAHGGTAILLVSSDLPEVLGLAQRLVVMRQGRTIAEMPAADATEEEVMALMSGVAERRAA